MRLILAGVEELMGFVESKSIDVDLKRLRNFPAAQQARDRSEADVVVLLTNGNYREAWSVVPGENLFIGPQEAYAYAIVETRAANSQYTFAHEIGHLFGGGHENDPRKGIPHAHKFRTGRFIPCIFGKKRRTILATVFAGGVRILHYSNPEVWFDGKRTGVHGWSDNAAQIRNTACVVAQFRYTIEPFEVTIIGDRYGCPCEDVTLEAVITGGTAGATYEYEWYESNDGIHWTPIAYTGPIAVVNVPCTEGDGIFVRVDVKSSDGNTSSDNTYIESAKTWPGQEIPYHEHLTGIGKGVDFRILQNTLQGQYVMLLNVKEMVDIPSISGMSMEI